MTKSRKTKLLIMTVVCLLSIVAIALVGCFDIGGSSGDKPSFEDDKGNITTSDATAQAYKTAVTKAKKSVVRIHASNTFTYGNAAGFFVTDSGYILTNAHALYGASPINTFNKFEINVLNDDNETYTKYSAEPAKNLPTNLPYDLALLKITDAPKGKVFPKLTFAPSSSVNFGDPCVIIGNPGTSKDTPHGLGLLAHSGMIGNPSIVIEHSQLDFPVIAVEAPVNNGNSGGPLINANGDVIGVVTSRISITGGNVDQGVFNLGLAQKSDDALIYLRACSVLDGLF